MPSYYLPLDPECPKVIEFSDMLFGDPMTKAMGAPVDEIMESFRRRHRLGCARCREFGTANIEVV